MSDFSTTDNDEFGKENEKKKKQKLNKKKKLSSITNRESIYKKENHFSIGVSRFKTYKENTTMLINTNNNDITVVTNNQSNQPTNKVRYDIYGTEIKKGSKHHKVSFIDELKSIPIMEVHEYCESNTNTNNNKVTVYKNTNKLSKDNNNTNTNDKDVIYCSSCVII